MPISSCRRRPISKPRISTGPTAPTGLQYAPAAVTPQGEARSNFRLAQELARRMGLADPVFGMEAKAAIGELLRGANGPVAGLDLGDVFRGRPVEHRAGRRTGIPHPLGQARILFGAAGRGGARADAGLAARSAGRARRRALAAAPVDRARLFPGAYGLFRRRVSAPARRRAVLHAASRGGREARARAMAPRCACSTNAARSGWC